MAISRKKKEELVEKYSDLLDSTNAVFLVDYRGMSVAEITRLRRQLADSGATLIVLKNTLFKRVLDQKGLSVPDQLLEGPAAMGAISGEVPIAAKLFRDFAATNQFLVLKGGLLDDRAIDANQIKALADIPPREVLLAKVVGGLQAPIAGLVNVLNGSIRNFVYVLQARVDQLNAESQ